MTKQWPIWGRWDTQPNAKADEPLPKNHPFWKQDNIRLWPHVAAETNPDTAAKQIANAIKCIDNNIVPPNTVDRTLGY